MDKKYYLGLDIGTESCGWAVTDENYNLIKAKGNKLWGVRLFEAANTAAERRGKRTNRRRLARRKLKLSWLRDIFANEIDKVDKNFLDRIKYSSLWEEDKVTQNISLNSKDSLFSGELDGKKFTDKEYFKHYPTIYHLRNELTKSPAKDIRLLYLALHNIIKRRGHFLYDGEFSDNGSIQDGMKKVFTSCCEYFDDLSFASMNTDNIEESVLSIIKQNLGLRDTKNEIGSLLKADKPKEKLLVNSFIDGKFDIKKMFDIEDCSEKLDFGDSNYDTKIVEVMSYLSEDQLRIVEQTKEVFSLIQLKKILGDRNYICEAMVDMYDKHKEQLRFFKAFIKKYLPNMYFKMFRDAQETTSKDPIVINYPAYVKGSIFDGKKRVVDINIDSKLRNKDEFYKYVKKVIDVDIGDEEFVQGKNQILSWIENDEFLNKQRSKSNSVFSNKLYVSEAKAILKQSAEKYDFLNDVDEKYGISNIEKIIQILEFRVPYFVGPIGECREGQKHSWAERQSNIEYKPWTLSQIVDLDKAEDEFINRMTNKCTYLRDKDVLPKNSILYAKFRVLNELNNLTINGQKISVDIKQLIFTNLFEKYKKVTINRVKDLLVGEGLLSKDEAKTVVIGGIDKDFANNYAPYVNIVSSQNFTKEFVDKNIDMFEEIIKYHTIISDKNRLAQRIKNKFGNVLNDVQIKEVKGWNYQGWGNLSREFLTLPFADKKDGLGVATNIIETMWTTNQNMQQIIFNSNYTLEEELDSLKEKGKTDLLYEDVEKLYCSPAVKRGVWQSIKIIKEIRDVMGSMPEKIFVEVTREDKEKGDKGRKDSRLTNLQEIYKSKEFKESTKAVAADIANLQNELNHKENNALRSEKLYLYFLQMGKCMYSGEPINIEDVANDKMYDIDHIIPQSIIKDDSIDNKVLVKSEYNRVKDNAYPIYSTHPQWVNKMKSYWKMLKDLKLISTKKYDNLIRIDDLAEEELSGFIARQLVETNQSAKAVLDLLKTIVDDPTKVVYSKAKFVSDFRNNHKIYKSRTVNDLHHAKDAYLNIVVGNVINSRFTSDPKNFYRKRNKNSNKTKNMNKLFDYGSVIYSPVTDEVVWDTNRDIERIKSTCFDNSCMVTKMSYSKLNGAYYDETVYKSAKNNPKSKAKVQLKGDTKNPISSVEKYGGYNSQNNSYFMVIEGEKKGKPIKVIESVPILMYQTYKNDKDFNDRILEHLAKENGISNARIVLPKVNFQSTLKIDNGLYWLSGSSGDMRLLYNANQWFVDNDTTRYVKALEKYSEIKKNRKDGDLKEIDGRVVLSPASKKNNTEIILSKVENEQLYHAICGQLSKDIYKGLQLDTGLREKMVSCEGDFCGKSVLEQAQLLLGVLNGVSTGAAMADMSILNESKFVGKLLINKNIANKDISLIIQSPTGLYTEEIKL